jgi:hypothetical protein
MRSAPGTFGRVCDAAVRIFRFKGIEDLLKWVDDFLFWRYARGRSLDGSFIYNYSEELIWSVAAELGWPWAPDKCLPFSSSFTYIGFHWDLVAKTVTLPEKKRVKYISRLSPWTAGYSASKSEIEVLIGTLNHVTLVVPDGRGHLPSLYKFRSSFPSDAPPFLKHKFPRAAALDTAWWLSKLQSDWCGINVIRPPTPSNIQLFVDASTSWGVGLSLDGKWLAWEFLPGWNTNGRDIGWAEMVAVELAVRTLISGGHSNSHIILHSDNQGVVGSIRSGRSRNSEQNLILRKIVSLFQDEGIWLTTKWIPSNENIADDPSRGRFPPRHTLYAFPPAIPSHLKPYILPSICYHDPRLQ